MVETTLWLLLTCEERKVVYACYHGTLPYSSSYNISMIGLDTRHLSFGGTAIEVGDCLHDTT